MDEATQQSEDAAAQQQTDIDALLAADVAALHAQQSAIRRANAEPLPGPLFDAFGFEPRVGNITIRPVVAGDFIILRAINSPIYRRNFDIAEFCRKVTAGEIPEDSPMPATPFTTEEAAGTIYQFTNPFLQVREVARAGAKQFTNRAVQFVAERIEPALVGELHETAVLNYSRAFECVVRYESVDRASGEVKMFGQLDSGKPDGLGWWLHYVARLCAKFNWSRRHVIEELPLAQGFAFLAWENEELADAEAVSPRYIRQEMDRLKELNQ